MPKDINITVYEFKELSDKAKDRARNSYVETFGYSGDSDALNSLKALAENFDGKIATYSIDWLDSSPSYAKFDMPDEDDHEDEDAYLEWLKGKIDALGSYDPETLKGKGDCVLTGYCMDEDAIDGLRIAYMRNGITDLNALMKEAFKSWLKACQADALHQISDEGMQETSEANEWFYLENGRSAPRE